jgi:dipeptidyl aminopeptidase/acylaminoacyl peptidase
MVSGEADSRATQDWPARFRVPRTLWARVAVGDPSRGLIASSRTGTYQLHRWFVDDGRVEAITDDPEGRTDGLLSPDGRWVVWHQDEAGGEVGPWITAPWGGGPSRPVTTDVPDAFSFLAAFSPAGRWFAAALLIDEAWTLSTVAWSADGPGRARLIPAGAGFVTDVAIDDDGTIAFATTGADGSLDTSVRILDPLDRGVVHEVRHGGAVSTSSFARDGSGRLLASTMQTGWKRPIVVARDGTERRFDLPDVAGDLLPTDWHRDGRHVLLLASIRSTTRLYQLDLDEGTARPIDHAAGAVAIGSSAVGAASFLPDGRILTTIEDGTAPPAVVALDPVTGASEALIEAAEGPPSRPWRSIDVPSTDGALVQAWLATPAGVGPFPTLIDIHGGPDDQENDRYAPAAQAWLDRGYAVVSVNYRGSNGFGREYEAAIRGQPGRCELDDLVATRQALVDAGIADATAVVPSGGSYGGYLTLLALTHQPELWAAGVAYVAIADWVLMYEDGDALRGYQEALFHGSPTERPEAYAAASPMTRVGELRAPLLVIQGRNDPRCPPRQLERFAEAAAEAGKHVEVDWFDAGHGSGGMTQRIAWQRRAMDFVDAALGRSD